uniref:ABC transmembrane type-1 domain-containing protein n=1 Tax=Elaeophora elaphi TaxID=1147741 RepID=A0A0R3RY95_9BILA
MSVFAIARLVLSSHLPSIACSVIAFATSSSLIFQLITLYGRNTAARKIILDRGSPLDMSFLWFIGPLSSHSCSEYYEALQSNIFWQLNVVHVSGTLLKDILILITSMLHWLFRLPVFALISLCILLSILAFFNYRFNLFYGLIRTEKQQVMRSAEHVSSRDTVKQLPDKKFVECKGEIKSLLLINELYQKAHAYASFVKSK